MSAFAKGLEPGKRVRQGQVIGFVGSTGQSTGAHVHYEILVNGRFVDPMRIKLPRGRSLEGPLMTGFEKERDRLDPQMSNRRRPHVRRHGRPVAGQQSLSGDLVSEILSLRTPCFDLQRPSAEFHPIPAACATRRRHSAH